MYGNSYDDFLVNNAQELKNSKTLLILVRDRFHAGKITDGQLANALERVEKVYDRPVVDFIDRTIGRETTSPDYSDIANTGFLINQRYGTEARMVLNAIEEFARELDVYIDEDNDSED